MPTAKIIAIAVNVPRWLCSSAAVTGPAGVGEDVPEQEDEDAGRERVQESLDRLRQALHSRHGEAEENGGPGDRAQPDGGGLVHSELVRAKATISKV